MPLLHLGQSANDWTLNVLERTTNSVRVVLYRLDGEAAPLPELRVPVALGQIDTLTLNEFRVWDVNGPVRVVPKPAWLVSVPVDLNPNTPTLMHD